MVQPPALVQELELGLELGLELVRVGEIAVARGAFADDVACAAQGFARQLGGLVPTVVPPR